LAVANTNFFREAHAQRDSAVSATSVTSLPSANASPPKSSTPQFNTSVFSSEPRAIKTEETIPEEPKSPAILDYEKLIKDLVEPWLLKGQKIGTVVEEQVWCSF
jgi:hypothetical protein